MVGREDSSGGEAPGAGPDAGRGDGGTVAAGGGGAATLAAELVSRAGRRVLVVGEAPARLSSAALAADSASGRRLRAWLGDDFQAVNLCSGRWSTALSRAAARTLRDEALAGREVVLLGRRVARAFARLDPALDALSSAAPFSMAAPIVPRRGGGWARSMVWLAPHPSGRSRWWNDPVNRRAGELFFRYVVGRLEFRFEADLPAPTELARTALDLLASELGGG